MNRYYPWMKPHINEVLSTLFTVGWNDDLELYGKYRLIQKSVRIVMKEIGFKDLTIDGKRGMHPEHIWLQDYCYWKSKQGTGQEQITKENWKDYVGTVSDREIGEVAGVSADTIFKYRKKRGIPSQSKLTPKQIEFIKENHQRFSISKLARIFSTSRKAIQHHIRRTTCA